MVEEEKVALVELRVLIPQVVYEFSWKSFHEVVIVKLIANECESI